MDDYNKLLKKSTALETKIHRLEVNVAVNGLYGNDSTLPLDYNNGKEHANTMLISTNRAARSGEALQISLRILVIPGTLPGRVNRFPVIREDV